jgi:hypothetical protein
MCLKPACHKGGRPTALAFRLPAGRATPAPKPGGPGCPEKKETDSSRNKGLNNIYHIFRMNIQLYIFDP